MKYLLAITALFLAANTLYADEKKPDAAERSKSRGVSAEQFSRGGALFQKYCAECHGANAEGAPNWTKRGPDGKYGPPPLNGTGHAWHHAKPVLVSTIKQGTLKIGGSMPPWGNKLSDEQIDDIIGWMISKWPQEVYDIWSKQTGHHK
jgi:mono/diheme cytochrome c family protein